MMGKMPMSGASSTGRHGDVQQAQGRLGLLEKLSYGAGDLSSNLMWGMTLSYLMYFYTDVYLLPAAAAAWVLLIPRTLDAFLDPLCGYIIDRTSGRYVKAWIGWLAIPFGVFAFLCFLPLPLSNGGKFAWALTTYIAFGIIYSGINTPYGVLSTMMTTTPQERVSLNSFRMVGCQGGQLIISALTLPLAHLFAGGDDVPHRQFGFSAYCLILSVVGSLCWIVTWRNTRVRQKFPSEKQKLSVLLSALFRNRHWHAANLITFMCFVVFCSEYGLAIHFTRFVLHKAAGDTAIILTIATGAAVVGAMLTPALTARFNVRPTFAMLLVFELINFAIMFWAGDRFLPFIAAFALQSLAVGAISPLCYTVLGEAIDYGRVKFGIPAAGLAYSINTLVSKVAAGLTGFVLANLLVWGHYTAQASAQNADLPGWLKLGFIGLPCSAICIALIALLFAPDNRLLVSLQGQKDPTS
jgi:GPH family glycoside/pentoside/hexuronide:cation symporter